MSALATMWYLEYIIIYVFQISHNIIIIAFNVCIQHCLAGSSACLLPYPISTGVGSMGAPCADALMKFLSGTQCHTSL